MTGERLLAYHRLRAPSAAGEVLVEPLLEQIKQVLEANRAIQPTLPSWLRELAHEARPALLFAAAQYTLQYRDVSTLLKRSGPQTPALLLAGHQPQLFHAGVWFKNFVLSSLAKAHDAVGINLIVDNDTISSASLRVPAGNAQEPRTEAVPFDAASDVIPFEERSILDDATFASFQQRVRETTQHWLPEMVLDELWPYASAARRRTSNLGYALCEARHKVEGDWGLHTLELPVSTVFSQPAFHRFLRRLLLDLPSFQAVYNACLHEYRRVNHVRSRAHPVPDLTAEDGWLEAPLWIWSRSAPRRQHLFARATPQHLELTDGAQLRIRLPSLDSQEGLALEQLAALEARGIRLRPRALLTTMYARLVLSDLFLHGIGGAKYDELTDAIIKQYFHVTPPTYLTATATLTLPLDFPRVDRSSVLAQQQTLRDMEFHAERFLPEEELTRRKQAFLADMPPRGSRKTWHAQFTAVQQQLAARTEPLRLAAEKQLRQRREEHRLSRLLGSREFSFCLFPTAEVQSLLLDRSRVPS